MSGDVMKFCGAHGVSGSLAVASSGLAAQACGDIPREENFQIIGNEPSTFISAGLSHLNKGGIGAFR